ALLLTGAIGGKKVRVPSVVGITQEGAATVLHRNHLNVQFDFVTNDRPKGTTLGQDPSPGTQVKEDSVVHVTVSNGPGNGQIPTVDRLTRRAARRSLTKSGFKIR